MGEQAANRAGQVKMDVAVVLSTTTATLDTLQNCREGSIIEMDKVSGDPVDVEVNGVSFAKGEVIVIGENFGVRVTEMVVK